MFWRNTSPHLEDGRIIQAKNQRESRLYLKPALKLVSCLAYSSDPQDGGDMFLRNVG
jgi:hypothetical protein